MVNITPRMAAKVSELCEGDRDLQSWYLGQASPRLPARPSDCGCGLPDCGDCQWVAKQTQWVSELLERRYGFAAPEAVQAVVTGL